MQFIHHNLQQCAHLIYCFSDPVNRNQTTHLVPSLLIAKSVFQSKCLLFIDFDKLSSKMSANSNELVTFLKQRFENVLLSNIHYTSTKLHKAIKSEASVLILLDKRGLTQSLCFVILCHFRRRLVHLFDAEVREFALICRRVMLSWRQNENRMTSRTWKQQCEKHMK